MTERPPASTLASPQLSPTAQPGPVYETFHFAPVCWKLSALPLPRRGRRSSFRGPRGAAPSGPLLRPRAAASPVALGSTSWWRRRSRHPPCAPGSLCLRPSSSWRPARRAPAPAAADRAVGPCPDSVRKALRPSVSSPSLLRYFPTALHIINYFSFLFVASRHETIKSSTAIFDCS